MVAILVAAENATLLPRLGKPRRKLRVQASQTAQESRQFWLSCCRAGWDGHKLTSPHRRPPPFINRVEKLVSGDTSVASERIHHARV